MTKVIEFFIEGNPKAQPRPKITTRGSFGHAYYPKNSPIHKWRETIKERLKLFKDLPSHAIYRPVNVSLVFLIARPDYLKNKKYPSTRIPHYKKKTDIDNLIKAVLDAFTKSLVWEDDGLVCAIHASKYFTSLEEQPGLWVKIEQLESIY